MYIYIYIFARPSAHGVIELSWSSSLFVTALHSPKEPSAPATVRVGPARSRSDPAEDPQHHGFCTWPFLTSTCFISHQIVKKS